MTDQHWRHGMMFDFSIDNSLYIQAASINASDRGIAEFEPELERAVKSFL
jgi:hypothetical protein